MAINVKVKKLEHAKKFPDHRTASRYVLQSLLESLITEADPDPSLSITSRGRSQTHNVKYLLSNLDTVMKKPRMVNDLFANWSYVVKDVDLVSEIPVPTYATSGAAGVDLHAAVSEPVVLAPGESTLIPTGLCIELPANYEAQIRPRSGLAAKNAVTVLNTPGTIDSDYRGEIKVILINNHPKQAFVVERGMRIAQMVIAPVLKVTFEQVDELSESERDEDGFGSTGV